MTSRTVFHSSSYKGQDFKIISDSAVISAIMFQSVYKPNISSGSQENLHRLFAAILASQHQRSPGNIVQGLDHFTSETRYNSKYQYVPNKNTPILLVPCIDVGSFVYQKLAYSWTAHLGGQSKRCPSILNRQKFKSQNHCAHLSSWPKQTVMFYCSTTDKEEKLCHKWAREIWLSEFLPSLSHLLKLHDHREAARWNSNRT